jgi:hypothetical protein
MKCSDHHQPTTALATFPAFFLFKKGKRSEENVKKKIKRKRCRERIGKGGSVRQRGW